MHLVESQIERFGVTAIFSAVKHFVKLTRRASDFLFKEYHELQGTLDGFERPSHFVAHAFSY